MRIEVFGSTVVVDDGGRTQRPGGPAATRILTHLVAARSRPVPAHTLVDFGWPDGTSAASLRMTMSRLRRLLNPAADAPTIVSASDGYLLVPEVDVDVRRFETALSETGRQPFSVEVLDTLSDVLDLWKGEPYADADDVSLEGERHRLSELRLEAAQRLYRCGVALGQPRAAHRHLINVAHEHPNDEGLTELAMRALYSVGDSGTALDLYERTRRWLGEQLGLAPSPELRALADAVLRHTIPAEGGIRVPATVGARIDGYGVGWIVRPALHRMSRADTAGGHVDATAHAIAAQAAISASAGDWDDALRGYTAAVGAALSNSQHIDAAEYCLRLARITWDPDVAEATAELIRTVLQHLDDETSRARLVLCLAGGLFRPRTVEEALSQIDDLRDKITTIETGGSANALGWGLTHFRDGLAGAITIEEASTITERIYGLISEDPLLFGQNVRADFALAMRRNDRPAGLRALRSMRLGMRPEPSVVDAFGLLCAENCWNLAIGRHEAVRTGLDAALQYEGRLGSNTYDQVVLGQSFWLARESGDPASIRAHMGGARALSEIDRTTPLWLVAAALLASDLGDHQLALTDLDTAMSLFDLTDLAPGPHRTGILAFVAEILAVATIAGEPTNKRLALAVAESLEADPAEGVLLGWPTVFIGPKSRYLAYAASAIGNEQAATAYAGQAIHDDRWMPAMRRRSLLAAAAIQGGVAGARFRAGADRLQRAMQTHQKPRSLGADQD